MYIEFQKGDKTAVYLFEFNRSGLINEKPASGSGQDTTMLFNEAGKWLLRVEHLGQKTVHEWRI